MRSINSLLTRPSSFGAPLLARSLVDVNSGISKDWTFSLTDSAYEGPYPSPHSPSAPEFQIYVVGSRGQQSPTDYFMGSQGVSA